jgi:hypothetical protein
MKTWEKVQQAAVYHYQAETACWYEDWKAGLRRPYQRPNGVGFDRVNCQKCLRETARSQSGLASDARYRLRELGFDK